MRSLFVSVGCPSLAVSPLTRHEQFLLAQSLAAPELSDVESMVSTSSRLVPEVSVEQLELSTPEVRWQSSSAPDLGRFPVSLPGCWFSVRVGGKFTVCLAAFWTVPLPQLGKKSPQHRSPSLPADCGQSCSTGCEKEKRGDSEVSSSPFSTHSAVPVLDPAPDPSFLHMPLRFCSHLVRKGW